MKIFEGFFPTPTSATVAVISAVDSEKLEARLGFRTPSQSLCSSPQQCPRHKLGSGGGRQRWAPLTEGPTVPAHAGQTGWRPTSPVKEEFLSFSTLPSSLFSQGLTAASQTAPQHPSPPAPPPSPPPISTPWNCSPQSCPPASPSKRDPRQAQPIPSPPPIRPWTLRKRPQVPEVRACVRIQARGPALLRLSSRDPEGSDPGEGRDV